MQATVGRLRIAGEKWRGDRGCSQSSRPAGAARASKAPRPKRKYHRRADRHDAFEQKAKSPSRLRARMREGWSCGIGEGPGRYRCKVAMGSAARASAMEWTTSWKIRSGPRFEESRKHRVAADAVRAKKDVLDHVRHIARTRDRRMKQRAAEMRRRCWGGKKGPRRRTWSPSHAG